MKKKLSQLSNPCGLSLANLPDITPCCDTGRNLESMELWGPAAPKSNTLSYVLVRDIPCKILVELKELGVLPFESKNLYNEGDCYFTDGCGNYFGQKGKYLKPPPCK